MRKDIAFGPCGATRASLQIRLRTENKASIPKVRLCKNGNLNLNAESKDSKVIAFPSMRAAGVACAA